MCRVRIPESLCLEDHAPVTLRRPEVQAPRNFFNLLPSFLLQVKRDSLHEGMVSLVSLLEQLRAFLRTGSRLSWPRRRGGRSLGIEGPRLPFRRLPGSCLGDGSYDHGGGLEAQPVAEYTS